MDCRLPGSSVHGIFQARVLEWGAIAFSIIVVKMVNFMLWVPDHNFNSKHIKSQQQQQNLCIIYLFRKQVSWYLPTPYPPICDGISQGLGGHLKISGPSCCFLAHYRWKMTLIWKKWSTLIKVPPSYSVARNVKSVYPPWKTVQRFLRKWKTELLYDPEIPLLSTYLGKTINQKDTCTPMSTQHY